ncbi:uncharacterized protein LOC110727096 [Chenopodium quinoa]|uniref:uncharacterized protein LOC110727096 n=1 Tax=Chenopodium quinoa TaxID=63459 RepID=UPI000B786224|nr:uncharacterized protein LOC110727096 [Chenopodium quinoa]
MRVIPRCRRCGIPLLVVILRCGDEGDPEMQEMWDTIAVFVCDEKSKMLLVNLTTREIKELPSPRLIMILKIPMMKGLFWMKVKSEQLWIKSSRSSLLARVEKERSERAKVEDYDAEESNLLKEENEQ